jgi:hypothetical protein
MGCEPLIRWTEETLAVELQRAPDALRLVFRGRSDARDPARFLLPLLRDAVARAQQADAPLVLDFRALDYMNSSTFTPIVKAIGVARTTGVPIVLEYDRERSWQALSFSALRTFETIDGRVQVQGK